MTSACLYSGGKDSTLALHKAHESGVKVDLLITMEPDNKSSYMFHFPNTRWTALSAEALGIKHVFMHTAGIKEDELNDLERVLVNHNVDVLITGATASKYQADRINALAKKLGLEHMAPLWNIDPITELKEIAHDYEAIISAVWAEGFDKSYLGARIDEEMIGKLAELNRRFGIHMLFEGGEAESFVLEAPLFKKRIQVEKAHVEWEGQGGFYIIESAKLVAKKK